MVDLVGDDVLRITFERLDVDDKIRMCCTCERWRVLFESELKIIQNSKRSAVFELLRRVRVLIADLKISAVHQVRMLVQWQNLPNVRFSCIESYYTAMTKLLLTSPPSYVYKLQITIRTFSMVFHECVCLALNHAICHGSRSALSEILEKHNPNEKLQLWALRRFVNSIINATRQTRLIDVCRIHVIDALRLTREPEVTVEFLRLHDDAITQACMLG